jgi:HAD superfamily hydrolase (TIGR01509 family)
VRGGVRYVAHVVRAVLFDLMDTVIRDPYREAIEAATGLPLAEALPLRDPRSWPDFEIAAIDESEFARRFFGARGADDREGSAPAFDLAAFHRARRAGYAFLPGVKPILESLRGRVRTFVASNYPVWIDELRVTHQLDALFDGVYASHHFRVRKPARAFYERLLEAIATSAEECLFVDDRAANCEGAARLGMRTHVFVDAETLREVLVAERVLD